MESISSGLPFVILILGVALSVFTCVFMWKNIHCFISKKDFYHSSPYGLFMKKIKMVASVGGIVLFVTVVIAGSYAKKVKQENKQLETVSPINEPKNNMPKIEKKKTINTQSNKHKKIKEETKTEDKKEKPLNIQSDTITN
jgi:hypothetical protein